MINDLVDQAAINDLRGPSPKPGTGGITIPYHDIVTVLNKDIFDSAVGKLDKMRLVVEADDDSAFASLLKV